MCRAAEPEERVLRQTEEERLLRQPEERLLRPDLNVSLSRLPRTDLNVSLPRGDLTDFADLKTGILIPPPSFLLVSHGI